MNMSRVLTLARTNARTGENGMALETRNTSAGFLWISDGGVATMQFAISF
jgi:hypothetical protein